MPQPLPVELVLDFERHWEPERRRWRLPAALAPAIASVRVWIDGTELPQGAVRLQGGCIALIATDLAPTQATKVYTEVALRRTARMGAFTQSILLALIAIVPAMLTFFTDHALLPHFSRSSVRATASADFADELNAAIASANNVRIVSNWLPQWLLNSSLEKALNNGAVVSATFLSDTAAALAKRSLELGHDSTYGGGRVRTGLQLLDEVRSRVGVALAADRLHVTFHDRLTAALIVQCDNRYFIGFYFKGQSVSDTFIIDLKAPPGTSIAQILYREMAGVFTSSHQ